MGRQMKVQWACDTPGCGATQETVSDNGYGSGSPPDKWGFLNLNLETEDEGCECQCHEYSPEWEAGDNEHDEDDCACAEEDEAQGQICICPKCVEKVQATYYAKTQKGGLL